MDVSNIIGLVILYIAAGYCISLSVRAYDSETTAHGKNTVGIILIWPLFVLSGIVFVISITRGSIAAAFERLFE